MFFLLQKVTDDGRGGLRWSRKVLVKVHVYQSKRKYFNWDLVGLVAYSQKLLICYFRLV